ncbi:MAG TPA: NF038129 family PEP-CTERM protein [Telluria sp.]|nr:NF038129 family PEP-CTERM protein [Telluria sp.]
MYNVKTLLRHAVLALALAGSSLAAMAAPISFHVDVNTTTLTGDGYLDLQFSALGSAPLTTVTFSNFTGAVGAVDFFDGEVLFNADGTFTLANLPGMGGLLSFNALFGGALGFDLMFSDDYAAVAGTDGSTLTVGLLDTAFAPIGGDFGIARFELTPGVGVQTSVNGDFAAIGPVVAAVPEPDAWLLLATGLGLLGFTQRRRAAR